MEMLREGKINAKQIIEVLREPAATQERIGVAEITVRPQEQNHDKKLAILSTRFLGLKHRDLRRCHAISPGILSATARI